MKVNISREGRYIPEWRGNRDEPEDEQVVVTYRHLDHSERDKYHHIEKTNISIEFSGKTDKEIEEQIDEQTKRVDIKQWSENDKIAVASKPTIQGLYDLDDNPIDTWQKLIDVPQSAENQIGVLIQEITTHLSTLSKEKDLKNSE